MWISHFVRGAWEWETMRFRVFIKWSEVIRTRDYGDLETLAHETGHHLDKKFGLNDPKFDDELMKLGSHTSGQNYTPEQIRQEGMAEFMRRYLLNPAMAEQEAPAFMKHFQNTIPEDVQKGLKKYKKMRKFGRIKGMKRVSAEKLM